MLARQLIVFSSLWRLVWKAVLLSAAFFFCLTAERTCHCQFSVAAPIIPASAVTPGNLMVNTLW